MSEAFLQMPAAAASPLFYDCPGALVLLNRLYEVRDYASGRAVFSLRDEATEGKRNRKSLDAWWDELLRINEELGRPFFEPEAMEQHGRNGRTLWLKNHKGEGGRPKARPATEDLAQRDGPKAVMQDAELAHQTDQHTGPNTQMAQYLAHQLAHQTDQHTGPNTRLLHESMNPIDQYTNYDDVAARDSETKSLSSSEVMGDEDAGSVQDAAVQVTTAYGEVFGSTPTPSVTRFISRYAASYPASKWLFAFDETLSRGKVEEGAGALNLNPHIRGQPSLHPVTAYVKRILDNPNAMSRKEEVHGNGSGHRADQADDGARREASSNALVAIRERVRAARAAPARR